MVYLSAVLNTDESSQVRALSASGGLIVTLCEVITSLLSLPLPPCLKELSI